ncbi:hypothetical protein NM688_g2184 [Phlebia brevispora]|uniref:Uncharacterized protein n=1 Tax=Phlebia brevispora TaxID=194682 RepID=A0ACC1T9C0_9APHY|nr:hypothetical protein NM688_g2184 [Phlebia brevispora]
MKSLPTHSSSTRQTVYKNPSPAQSTTSLSDENDDEDFNKSTFFASPEPVAASPAQWSRIQLLPNGTAPPHPQTSGPHAARLPPEILIHILKHLHNSRDLYHAMLVSRAWCECSVELLWHRPNFAKLTTLGKMMRVIAGDDQTFIYARFIRRLNFLYLGADLTDSLFSRLAQCVRLERLTLINCTSLTDGALARVLPCCPNLVALDLTGVVETTDRAVVALASSTKRLQGINLSGCKKVTDQGILALAANCPLLRRVKLSSVELITDEAVSALAKSCPLLLEIDLNNCKQVTDVSVRDLWLFSSNMREMRLSHCVELTDAAFPASPKSELALPHGPNPFPTATSTPSDRLPPLRLNRQFEHLRMLDLTACAAITDEAIEGIVAVAPKIRNLVLAKCSQLTDNAVESICLLGKHLHYLHLGHAGSITDRSIHTLARSCTRLRYIDLANCLQLTDMSVFELSSLQKLRRIGLVRVNNLTDQAIYALAEQHASLERIHLSYCDQISVMAIHFLLEKLPKLTHLSLTGIPAFRRPELQQFCREPPSEFNSTQRAAFCVYSGAGVSHLRDYLVDLFNTINDEMGGQSGTEYDDDTEGGYPEHMDVGEEEEEEGLDEEDTPVPRSNDLAAEERDHVVALFDAPSDVPHPMHISREMLMSRERASMPIPRNNSNVSSGAQSSSAPGPSRRSRGFGHQPIVEASTSPTPSDAASNRSGGTNHSTGTGFFRHYTEMVPSPRAGVITPDLVFAEIGHGRGAGAVAGPSNHVPLRRGTDSVVVVPPHTSYTTMQVDPPSFPSSPSSRTLHGNEDGERIDDFGAVLADTSNSYLQQSSRTDSSWTHVQHEPSSRSLSASPTTRELQQSVQSILGYRQVGDGRDADGRGRSVKRSLRSTITAAEQYASSFFFGRGSSGGAQEGGPSTHRDGR